MPGSCGSKVSGSLVLVVLWFSGSLVLWFSGSLVLWFSGSLVLWFSGSCESLVVFSSSSLALLFSGSLCSFSLVLFFSGSVVLGLVVFWLSFSLVVCSPVVVVLWFFICFVLWYSGSLVLTGLHLHINLHLIKSVKIVRYHTNYKYLNKNSTKGY